MANNNFEMPVRPEDLRWFLRVIKKCGFCSLDNVFQNPTEFQTSFLGAKVRPKIGFGDQEMESFSEISLEELYKKLYKMLFGDQEMENFSEKHLQDFYKSATNLIQINEMLRCQPGRARQRFAYLDEFLYYYWYNYRLNWWGKLIRRMAAAPVQAGYCETIFANILPPEKPIHITCLGDGFEVDEKRRYPIIRMDGLDHHLMLGTCAQFTDTRAVLMKIDD